MFSYFHHSNFLGESPCFTLRVPLFYPRVRANGFIHLLKVLTRGKICSLDLLTAMEINIALPAVSKCNYR
jgi:hypothetical protein